MQKSFLLFLLPFLLIACSENKKTDKINQPAPVVVPVSKISVYEDFSSLEPVLLLQNDTTYVINFWATSCKPCIEEMPHFEKLHEVYAAEKMRVLLVSLDLKRHLESRVEPFVEKKNIQNEVMILADQNYSKWTDKIDASWYGALPATLIYMNTTRRFFFGAFESFEDLEKEVTEVMEVGDDSNI